MLLTTLLISCLIPATLANVEKEIFLGPQPLDSSVARVLEDKGLKIRRLTPRHQCPHQDKRCTNLETTLSTSFSGLGAEHWVLLDMLSPDQRYEVRICWPATQPTDFKLEFFTPPEIISNDVLLESIRRYTANVTVNELDTVSAIAEGSSNLYLRVFAKTAYVTNERSRMENPDPVDVDIILDPFYLNVIPESLLPTVGWVTIIAISSWWLSGYVYRVLLGIAAGYGGNEEPAVMKQKKKV